MSRAARTGGGACARVRRAAGRRTLAEAGVAGTAGRRRPELAAGLAAVLACQAVARLRPRAPPSRSAPSHRPVRARAEAAVRSSRSSGSAAAAAVASRRVPRERRRRHLAARRREHLPRPARRRSVSAPPSPAAEPANPGPHSRRRRSLPRNTCCCSLLAWGGDTVADVLAGEAAARPGQDRPPALGPSGEGSGHSVAGPGSAPRRWARPQPCPRARERGACASAAGVCGLWAASRLPERVVRPRWVEARDWGVQSPPPQEAGKGAAAAGY